MKYQEQIDNFVDEVLVTAVTFIRNKIDTAAAAGDIDKARTDADIKKLVARRIAAHNATP